MSFEYSKEFEQFLKEEGEKAECYGIMHLNASSYYNKLSNLVNIPVIAVSSFIGFFTALQLFPNQNIILGCLGICVSMLKTLDSYFDLTKKSETHRLISLRYSKLSKLIQIQLSLQKSNRIDAKDFYFMITNDLANLRDSEPVIPSSIIDDFKIKYSHENTFKPPICNGLTKIKIFNSPVASSDNIEMQNIFFAEEKKEDEKKEEKKENTNCCPDFDNIDDQVKDAEDKKSERRFYY